MIAASTYLPRAASSTIAASSIHGTGAQNLVSALRNGFAAVSGIAFGPNFSSRRRASSPVRPVGGGRSLAEAIVQKSLRQQLANRLQFPPAFRGGSGICHLEFIERIQDNLGNNQPGIFLVVGRNNVPGRVMGAGGVQAGLICLHVMLPVFPLVNVGEAEFPVLVRMIDALEESLALFFLRKVEKYFDDPRSVAIQVALQVHDGAIALLPDGFRVAQLFRKPLAEENLRMHPHNQHLFVIGTIEDADLPAFRKPAGGAPENIVFQLSGAGLFETENLAALRIDPAHDVPNGAVLAGGVHPLKDQEQRIAAGRVVKLLQGTQLLNVFSQEFSILLLRFAKGLHNGRPLAELDILSGPHPEVL